MFVIGIDPGLRGGIVLAGIVHTQHGWRCELIQMSPMPVTDSELEYKKLTATLREMKGDECPVVIEKTLALPGQAVKAAFSQGYNLGVVHAAIESTGNKPIEVAPITWTTWLHKYARRTKDSKKDTWNALQAILPEKDLALVPRTPRSKVPHDGIVDAIGIALWWAVEGHKR